MLIPTIIIGYSGFAERNGGHFDFRLMLIASGKKCSILNVKCALKCLVLNFSSCEIIWNLSIREKETKLYSHFIT